MGNCLKTSLKSEVQNADLMYFDSILLKCTKKSGFNYINVGLGLSNNTFSGRVEILSNNGYLTGYSGQNLGQEHDYVSEPTVKIIPDSDEEVVIKVSPKTSVKVLTNNEGINIPERLDYLNYCINLDTWLPVRLNLTTDALASLYLPSLRTFDGEISGNINAIAGMSSLANFLGGSELTGDVVSFFNAKRSYISSGQMLCRFGTGVKFNDVAIRNANLTYVWDATSIIAKTDISAASPTAWTYGASAAQISELEGQGYTVVQVDS